MKFILERCSTDDTSRREQDPAYHLSRILLGRTQLRPPSFLNFYAVCEFSDIKSTLTLAPSK